VQAHTETLRCERIYYGSANGFLLLRGDVLQNADERDVVYKQSTHN